MQKIKEAAIRARPEKLLGGEKPSKRGKADEKGDARKQEIKLYGCGVVTKKRNNISSSFAKYYSDFFACREHQRERYCCCCLHLFGTILTQVLCRVTRLRGNNCLTRPWRLRNRVFTEPTITIRRNRTYAGKTNLRTGN